MLTKAIVRGLGWGGGALRTVMGTMHSFLFHFIKGLCLQRENTDTGQRRQLEAVVRDGSQRQWSETAVRDSGQRRQSETVVRDGSQRQWSETAVRGSGQRQQSEAVVRDGSQRHRSHTVVRSLTGADPGRA